MLGATSGHFDARPKIDALRVNMFLGAGGRLRFAAVVRTPRGERDFTGVVPLRPRTFDIRTVHRYLGWLVSAPLHSRLHVGPSGDVLVAATAGSMLIEAGVVLFAREEIEAQVAHRTVLRELRELQLTPLQVRELSWRVRVPGASASRFAQGARATENATSLL